MYLYNFVHACMCNPYFLTLPKVAIGGLASDGWLQLCLSKARNVVVAFPRNGRPCSVGEHLVCGGVVSVPPRHFVSMPSCMLRWRFVNFWSRSVLRLVLRVPTRSFIFFALNRTSCVCERPSSSIELPVQCQPSEALPQFCCRQPLPKSNASS